MSLKEKLQEDLKSSMKNKDTIRKSVVTLIRAAIKQYEVDNLVELADEANRDDLIEETKSEIQVLEGYLPQQLSEEELEKIVIETIAEVGATSMKDMGKIMATIKPKTAGRADGRKINELVKKNL